jgi:hypothetical protein
MLKQVRPLYVSLGHVSTGGVMCGQVSLLCQVNPC